MGDLTKDFNRSEFECNCGCGFNTVDYELANALQELRDHFDKSVTISSGCRCAAHNAREGGKPSSQHLLGRAADIAVSGVTALRVQEYLKDRYPNKFGIGSYDGFTHLDTRSVKARW